ncbi:MAG: GNAT family N-acetyltransferase [Clostridiales bacterium]|nr:GNAT family N-acetyltransferase [Clostridiales bacterium]
MEVALRLAQEDDKEILRNLLEKFLYEFSQYDGRGVNKLGLCGYNYLDFYWTEQNRWAYLIEVDGWLAGFALVYDYPETGDRETNFSLAEFFVIHKYRRLGVGKQAFFSVLDKHRGKWQLKRHPRNIIAARFWDKVISEYTHGNFELIEAYPNTEYNDGALGDIFFFDNSL